jgi:hypothetical protein
VEVANQLQVFAPNQSWYILVATSVPLKDVLVAFGRVTRPASDHLVADDVRAPFAKGNEMVKGKILFTIAVDTARLASLDCFSVICHYVRPLHFATL